MTAQVHMLRGVGEVPLLECSKLNDNIQGRTMAVFTLPSGMSYCMVQCS